MKWKVYFRDTFDGTSWREEFETQEQAEARARHVSGVMLTAHVENPKGQRLQKFGSY